MLLSQYVMYGASIVDRRFKTRELPIFIDADDKRVIGAEVDVRGRRDFEAQNGIPNSLQNPKILVGYDPEIISDGISPFCPLLWQSSAEEIEDSVDEVAEARRELVVGHFACMTAHNLSMALRWGA